MIEISGAPKLEGLTFRRFRDSSDYAVISSLGRSSWKADGVENVETEEDLASEYIDLSERDPSTEILIAEVRGEPVGYGRIWPELERNDNRVFWHNAHVLPEWRKTGLRLALFHFNEEQARLAAQRIPKPGSTSLESWALEEPNDWREMLIREGYTPSMYFYEMIRRILEDVPDYPLPGGVELRAARPAHYPEIWEARKESLREKPWFVESRYDKEHYELWLKWSIFMPDMWQVAWEGDHVVGMAENHVPVENEAFGRRRGHTQILFVVPRWRRRGLAKALLARSLARMREMGLDEVTLDVETQNTSGEMQLYESMGFRVSRKYAHYRKPLIKNPTAAGPVRSTSELRMNVAP